MKTLIILSALVMGLISTNTSNAGDAPKDFRIIMRDGGGMARNSAEYFISKDSSYADMRDEDARTKIYFKVSNNQLDDLYNIITMNSFEGIETFTEMVYDRGGTVIEVRADGETHTVDNSGMSFIKENWRNEWEVIEGTIRSVIASEIEKTEKAITINIDDNIMEVDKIVNFNIGDFTYMSARDGWNKTVTVRLHPGQHYMYFTMLNKELTTEPGSKIFAQGDGIVNIDKDTKSLYIYREGEKILWK